MHCPSYPQSSPGDVCQAHIPILALLGGEEGSQTVPLFLLPPPSPLNPMAAAETMGKGYGGGGYVGG